MSYSLLCWNKKTPEHIFVHHDCFGTTPQGEESAKELARFLQEELTWEMVEVVKTVEMYKGERK